MVVCSKKPNIKDNIVLHHQALGRMGESAVKNLLISKGFTLIEVNYRQKCGELDLIMARNDIVSFFEVKTPSQKKLVPSFSFDAEASAVWKISKRVNGSLGYRFRQEKVGYQPEVTNLNVQLDGSLATVKDTNFIFIQSHSFFLNFDWDF
jgi:putative endonuclease